MQHIESRKRWTSRLRECGIRRAVYLLVVAAEGEDLLEKFVKVLGQLVLVVEHVIRYPRRGESVIPLHSQDAPENFKSFAVIPMVASVLLLVVDAEKLHQTVRTTLKIVGAVTDTTESRIQQYLSLPEFHPSAKCIFDYLQKLDAKAPVLVGVEILRQGQTLVLPADLG